MSQVTVSQILEDKQKFHPKNPKDYKHPVGIEDKDGNFHCVGCHWCSPAQEDWDKWEEAKQIIDLTERWNASARDKQTYSIFGYYGSEEGEF